MTLADGKERLQKLITAAGLCSRREAEEWIKDGRVTLNGQIATIGQSAGPGDDVRVDGSRLRNPHKIYLALHKPKGYVTTLNDIYGQKTVMDLVKTRERIIPVGRLDKDTTGLLLMTNDGDFANKVMHPSYETDKTYEARLDKPFDPKHGALLLHGIKLKEGFVKCSKVVPMGERSVSVTLHQGYNHVVKRILNEIGYWVHDLRRARIGPIKLDMPLGAYRSLTKEEITWFLERHAKNQPRPRSPGRHRANRRDQTPKSHQSRTQGRRTSGSNARSPGPRSRQA